MAKRKTLKCPKCERRFSMRAHLARHLSTTHASTNRRSKAAKVSARCRRGGTATGTVPTPNSLLDALQTHFAELTAQRDGIDAQLDAIRQAMSAINATVPRAGAAGSGPKSTVRAGRAGSLKDYIVRVLRGRGGALAPREIATAVKKAGYKTKSDDLTKAVSNALSDTPGVRKVSRGQYTA